MITRRFSTARLVALSVLATAFCLGSQTFVPSAYGCGSTNNTDCRTSTGGGGTGKTDSGVMAFLARIQMIVDAGAVLIP